MILGKELKEKQNDKWRKIALETFADGRDEMNLAEFPLAAIGDRFLDGTKTVVFSDTVWDREKREHLPRQLTISGSDRYGLPTAKDDDILLACIQLSSIGDFHDREVQFSRYELLKLMRWPDESRYYHRLSTSLRRWKGTTVARRHFNRRVWTAPFHPGALVPGIMGMGFLTSMIHKWAPRSTIRHIDTVFRAPVLADHKAIVTAVVTDIDEDTGEVELDLSIKNEADETRVFGTATVAVPVS